MKRRKRFDDDLFVWFACWVCLAWTAYLGLTQQYAVMLLAGTVGGIGMSLLERERARKFYQR